jgi:hypothetical protein
MLRSNMPPPWPTPAVSQARRWDWDRRDPHGLLRMAIVFVGAFIGGFVVWPLIRPAVVADSRPHYADEARGYAAPAPSVGNRGRHQ